MAINRRVRFHCPMCRESLFSDKINYIRANVIDDEVLPPLQVNMNSPTIAISCTVDVLLTYCMIVTYIIFFAIG